MRSFRAYSLVALAAAGLALSSLVAVAQPADPPKPADAPRGPGGAGQPGQPGDGAGRGRPQPGRRGGDESMVPASTRQAMSIMNRAIRTLKGQVSDGAKKEENLRLVSDMQRGCLGAKAPSIGRPAAPSIGRTAVARADGPPRRWYCMLRRIGVNPASRIAATIWGSSIL